MSREAAVLVMAAIAVALLGLVALGWWRRVRRDRGIAVPYGELPSHAVERGMFPGLYVATTRHDQPLERLALRSLAYRAKVDVTVTTAGVALDLPGQPRIVIAADRIVAADQSTVVIDRVVERDGLTRIAWRTDDGDIVDSYFRPQRSSARALADAVHSIIGPTETGTQP